MAEISAKPFFHRLQTQTHIFAKFHFSIIFTQKVRAKRKKKGTSLTNLFFGINIEKKSELKTSNSHFQGLKNKG